MRRWGLFFFIAMSLGSCVHYQTANQVRFLSMVSNPKPGKSLGSLVGEDCATKVLGYGRSNSSLTIENAIGRMSKDKRLSYLRNVYITQPSDTADDSNGGEVFKRDCIVVRAEGFQ